MKLGVSSSQVNVCDTSTDKLFNQPCPALAKIETMPRFRTSIAAPWLHRGRNSQRSFLPTSASKISFQAATVGRLLRRVPLSAIRLPPTQTPRTWRLTILATTVPCALLISAALVLAITVDITVPPLTRVSPLSPAVDIIATLLARASPALRSTAVSLRTWTRATMLPAAVAAIAWPALSRHWAAVRERRIMGEENRATSTSVRLEKMSFAIISWHGIFLGRKVLPHKREGRVFTCSL